MLRGLFRRQKDDSIGLYESGYNYAAGQMLRGSSPEKVESQASHSQLTAFDRGILNAVKDFHLLVREVKAEAKREYQNT